jgi:hypothetical protein
MSWNHNDATAHYPLHLRSDITLLLLTFDIYVVLVTIAADFMPLVTLMTPISLCLSVCTNAVSPERMDTLS